MYNPSMPADKPTDSVNLTPLADIPGIGPRRAELLARLGLVTHDDLLHFAPYRYEDRRHLQSAGEMREGQTITVRGKIHSAKTARWRGGRFVFEIMVGPAAVTEKKELVRGCWFNMYYLPKMLVEGKEIFLYGKLGKSKSGTWMMMFPDFELIENDAESFIHIDRIAPIYKLTEGLKPHEMRKIMFEATQRTPFHAPEFYPAPTGLMPRQEAFKMIH